MLHPFLRRASLAASLLAGLALGAAAPARADAPLTVLHAFAALNPNSTNADGDTPRAPVISPGDGYLYGTTSGGGPDSTVGTVYRVKRDGTGFQLLHAFTPTNDAAFPANSDGAQPSAALLAPGDGFLYGTAPYGGPNGSGVVFRLHPDGSGFTVVHAFSTLSSSVNGTNGDGYQPFASLVSPGDGFLYGTADGGGANGQGTVFRVSPDGTMFQDLHDFSAPTGEFPMTALTPGGDGYLYGTAEGGAGSTGTVFRIHPDGTGFEQIHAFGALQGYYANADGTNPSALIVPGDGYLYGTAGGGNPNGTGTIFRLRPDGSGFAVIYAFSGFTQDGNGANPDGAYPDAGLIAPGDGYFYGTAEGGGPNADGVFGSGTVFRLRPDGSGFQVLHAFSAPASNTQDNAEGYRTFAPLVAPGDGLLYGTAPYGGPNGSGTVFRLTLSVPTTHLLWDNPDGKAAFWDVASDGSLMGLVTYGPYTDSSGSLWHATALATGPDGVSHLLWNSASGQVALWDVTDDGTATVRAGYGPYTDGAAQTLWVAKGLSVGPDNAVHLLWTNPDHRAAFWNVGQDGTPAVLAGYGPYFNGSNPWDAAGISTGPDNVSHLLWDNADHTAAFWDVSDADGSATVLAGYGPFTDGSPSTPWGAVAVSTGPDNVSHLLWDNADYKAAFWDVSDGDGTATVLAGYGPFTDGSPNSPWTATSLTTGPDGVSHLLWNNVDGKVALWSLDGMGHAASVTGFGPYTDGSAGNLWRAVGVSAGP